MNWLAHLFLSDPAPATRIGNLLPDFLRADVLARLPPEFQPGILQHRRSVQRFAPPFRRYGGILVDIFYDHLLARDWPSFAPQPLPQFAAEVYASFDLLADDFPAAARTPLRLMREADWLCSYAALPGIEDVLHRLGQRLRRPFDLAAAVPHFQRQLPAFEADFREFFPQLRAHLAGS